MLSRRQAATEERYDERNGEWIIRQYYTNGEKTVLPSISDLEKSFFLHYDGTVFYFVLFFHSVTCDYVGLSKFYLLQYVGTTHGCLVEKLYEIIT